jgi:hypothetical protein
MDLEIRTPKHVRPPKLTSTNTPNTSHKLEAFGPVGKEFVLGLDGTKIVWSL